MRNPEILGCEMVLDITIWTSTNLNGLEERCPLNETKHPIANTLQPIYDNYKTDPKMYMFYNDETPEKRVSYTHGHTKGVISFDMDTGFWLVHSLPRFPNYANSSYEFPHSGHTNGQTFLCMSFSYKESFNDIGKLLLYNWPQIYDSALPENMKAGNPNMTSAMKGNHVEKAPFNMTLRLKTLGGNEFQAFAKFSDFNADLYDHWIAPYYQAQLYTETWQNGVGKLPSNCSTPYKVYNVKDVTIVDESFTETKDHSKWAVTENSTYVCIGDINRAKSQYKRCGGTVCFNHTMVSAAFYKAVTDSEPCPKPQVIVANYDNDI